MLILMDVLKTFASVSRSFPACWMWALFWALAPSSGRRWGGRPGSLWRSEEPYRIQPWAPCRQGRPHGTPRWPSSHPRVFCRIRSPSQGTGRSCCDRSCKPQARRSWRKVSEGRKMVENLYGMGEMSITTYLQVVVGHLLLVDVSHLKSSVGWSQGFDLLGLHLLFIHVGHHDGFIIVSSTTTTTDSQGFLLPPIAGKSAPLFSHLSAHRGWDLCPLSWDSSPIKFARAESGRACRSMHFSRGVESAWMATSLS